MQLSEFLSTASADHAEALQQARNYQPEPRLWRIEGPVRKTQVETGLIIHGTRERLDQLISDVNTHADVMDLAKKVRRAIGALYEPEFYINLGDPEVAAMITAAETYGVLNTDEIARIRAAATYQDPNPFAAVTLHQVLLARNAVPQKTVTHSDGYVTISINQVCEQHNPRLVALNPRTQQWQRINSFYGVSEIGAYDCAVPTECSSWELAVDNPYGAIE